MDRLGSVYLVSRNRFHKTAVTIWIQIVGPNKDLLITRRYREGANPSHDIAYGFSRSEEFHEPFVLRAESTVPVHLGVIEAEGTILLLDFDL